MSAILSDEDSVFHVDEALDLLEKTVDWAPSDFHVRDMIDTIVNNDLSWCMGVMEKSVVLVEFSANEVETLVVHALVSGTWDHVMATRVDIGDESRTALRCFNGEDLVDVFITRDSFEYLPQIVAWPSPEKSTEKSESSDSFEFPDFDT